MSQKEEKNQSVDDHATTADEERAKPAPKTKAPSREDRLAEALRANLRRRKSAAKARTNE